VEAGDEKKKVIIIDDEESVLALTKGVLGRVYDLTLANSGRAALSLFSDGYTPDFVLLDLSMPEMGGWETFVKIREINRLQNTPIAIYTTSEDPKDKAKAQEVGAVTYIKKPAPKAVLLDTVAKYIN